MYPPPGFQHWFRRKAGVLRTSLRELCQALGRNKAAMGDGGGDSGSENGEARQVDWGSLESQLSAGVLESLREHLQVTKSMRSLCGHFGCCVMLLSSLPMDNIQHADRCACTRSTCQDHGEGRAVFINSARVLFLVLLAIP